ncbi:unnamed protein product [Menidia menidia]|uniref:(Atlantic silverside) hypothetical protein n=1 Tax=Menidia menidia TaxID=238744 RepID=A0A8S4ALP6_9TELE|nr:unnamed protein product [Menidia menidia]
MPSSHLDLTFSSWPTVLTGTHRMMSSRVDSFIAFFCAFFKAPHHRCSLRPTQQFVLNPGL